MFNLTFNNMVQHFLSVAKFATVSSDCNKDNTLIPTHISYAMCFFIISSLVAVIINLVDRNEIIRIAIIVLLVLSVNHHLNQFKPLNKNMG